MMIWEAGSALVEFVVRSTIILSTSVLLMTMELCMYVAYYGWSIVALIRFRRCVTLTAFVALIAHAARFKLCLTHPFLHSTPFLDWTVAFAAIRLEISSDPAIMCRMITRNDDLFMFLAQSIPVTAMLWGRPQSLTS